MKAEFSRHILQFKKPGGTSRGVLHTKETYFIRIRDKGRTGYGECAVFRGLSCDDRPDYEEKLQWLCDNIGSDMGHLKSELLQFPSIHFGLEQAMLSLNGTDPFTLFPSDFTDGEDKIVINGLIWMGDRTFMRSQIEEKLREGFTTIKLKIGALDFDTELGLIRYIREQYPGERIEIRVDANGAFSPREAPEKLKRLSDLGIHSIEQPIRAGQWEEMAGLCDQSPVPIALDEELIGVFTYTEKLRLLQAIAPKFIIIKPSLIGGVDGTLEWLRACQENQVKWWITSALESNLGLNAIAQFTYVLNNPMPQGLGTGGLFTNNIDSPLKVKEGGLWYEPDQNWGNMDHLFDK